MSNLKQIKNRIKSVKNTKKVTKTMELISAIKMQKSIEKAFTLKNYSKKLKEILNNSLNNLDTEVNLNYFRIDPKSQKDLLIVIASDKGLCGSYNIQIKKEVIANLNLNSNADIILVGKKLSSTLNRNNAISYMFKFTDYNDLLILANSIFQSIIKILRKEDIRSVKIIYTNFISMGTQEVITEDLLPFKFEDYSKKDNHISDLTLESNTEEVLEFLTEETIRTNILNALSQAIASEHLSRMIAMKNATDSSQEIIEALQLLYNKTRQANITQEITEIISGMLASEVEQTKNLEITNKIFINI